MKKLERFIPQTPDPYLKQADQLGAVKFGHINALVDAINSTIYGDYLQLEGDGPMSTTLRALEDPEGNKAKLFLATDQTKIEGLLTITDTLSIEGRLELKADPTATTQTTAVIQATDTNSGIAIVPNGTGAITLSTTGDARGSYAVDLQRSRASNSNVSSGNYSVIIGGQSNTSNGQYSVSGGFNNLTNGLSSVAFGSSNTTSGNSAIAMGTSNQASNAAAIAMGNGNIASGTRSVALGLFNTASSNQSTVSGGQSNTASTNSHATVVGGYQNSSTGQYSVSGGYSNVASGQGSVALGYNNTASGRGSVALGFNNTASGQRSVALGRFFQQATGEGSFAMGYYENIASGVGSVAIGGIYNTASATYGFAKGISAKAYLYNQEVRGGGAFTGVLNLGDAQYSDLIPYKQETLTTGATTTVSSNLIPDGNNRVWNVTVKYTAVVTSITGTATGVSVGDCKNEVLTIGFKKIGGTSSVVGSLNTVSTNQDSSMSTASFGVSAGASQEMKLDFTAPTFIGGGSITTRVVAKVELTECGY